MCVYMNIYKCKVRLLLLGLKKRHALHTRLESTHGLNLGCRKGITHWTRIFIPSRTKHILGHQWCMKMAFHGINKGKHFIYCHLMHALMSTCDPMSFKISSCKWSTMMVTCLFSGWKFGFFAAYQMRLFDSPHFPWKIILIANIWVWDYEK